MPENKPTDWPALVDELNRLLRLKTTPIGMKLFERVEDMQAIPKLRRPSAIHTADQGRARAFVDHVQAGMVAINGPTFGSEPHTPFGGFRASGNGFRECGTEVLDFYSEWKAVNTWVAPR